MKPYLALFLSSLIVPLSACGASENVTAIAFDKTAYSLDVGEQVSVHIRYTGSGKTAKFFSSNELVARIDEQGVLTGVARGEATIYAVCNDIVARAMVMVSSDIATDKIYQSKGTMSVQANVSAFAFEGSLSSPFTFISGSEPLKLCYFAHELPEKELLQSFLNFMDSPFIQENPNFQVPDFYEAYKAAVETLLTKEGAYSVRHLLREEKITSYFYAGDAYVSKAYIDVSKASKAVKYVELALNSNLSTLTIDDIVSLIKSNVDEGEKAYESKELNLLFQALANATYATKNETDSLGLTITIGEGFGPYLLEYLGTPELGQAAKLNEIRGNLGFKKKGEHYEIETISAHFDATLFGTANTFDANVSIPGAREQLAQDALDKIVEELEANK